MKKDELGGACGLQVEGRVLNGRPEDKRPLGRSRCRWEENIKLELRDIGTDGENWIEMPQNRVQWWAYLNAVMNFLFP
jgi:transposase